MSAAPSSTRQLSSRLLIDAADERTHAIADERRATTARHDKVERILDSCAQPDTALALQQLPTGVSVALDKVEQLIVDIIVASTAAIVLIAPRL